MSAKDSPRLTVGLIGLGNMGTAFAERLLDGGYDLLVYNRTAAKADPLAARGATVADTAADLAERVDVVLTSLPNDEVLASVAEEVVPAMEPGGVLVDLSTVSPGASTRVAGLADEASVAYLRAPVSGNPTVVRSGNLSIIVSGPRETLDRVEQILEAIGPTVQYVGAGEQARIVKLALNLIVAGLAQLMSEALVLGEASDVSRRDLLETMGSSAVGAPFVKYKTEPLLHDDFSATFTTALMEKDIDLILDAAKQVGLELPVAQELKSLLRATAEAGYADDDFMALYLRQRSASLDQEVVR